MQHGTRAGYVEHRRRGEDPCGPCTEGQARGNRAYRARTASRMQLPVELIVELYSDATIGQQVKIEKALGQEVVDTLLARFDGGTR